eukprot:g4242.t1
MDRALESARRLQYASRRPLTAFMVFAGEMRSKILRSNPEGTSDAILGRQLVDRWMSLTEDEKKVYEDKAIQDRAFLVELSKLIGGSKSSQRSAGKKRKARDIHAPKNAMTAYMFYSKAARPRIKEKNPTASFGELGKLIGNGWRNLPDSDKKPFEELARKDKERYNQAKANYIAKLKLKKKREEEKQLQKQKFTSAASADTGSKNSENDRAATPAEIKALQIQLAATAAAAAGAAAVADAAGKVSPTKGGPGVIGSPQLLALAMKKTQEQTGNTIPGSPVFASPQAQAAAAVAQAANEAARMTGSPVLGSADTSIPGYKLMKLGTEPGSPQFLVKTSGPSAPTAFNLNGGGASPQQKAAQAQMYNAAARHMLVQQLQQQSKLFENQINDNESNESGDSEGQSKSVSRATTPVTSSSEKERVADLTPSETVNEKPAGEEDGGVETTTTNSKEPGVFEQLRVVEANEEKSRASNKNT